VGGFLVGTEKQPLLDPPDWSWAWGNNLIGKMEQMGINGEERKNTEIVFHPFPTKHILESLN